MKNLILTISAVTLSYFFAEIFYSSLVINHFIHQKTYYFTEAIDPEGHIQFDQKIGYRISKTPSRYGAVVSDGRLQSMGTLKGNNYGLPDARDFYPKKKDSSTFRVAVLGDSFTASQFTQFSWLQRFEDSLNSSDQDSFELLNFSVDGGGLANWHGILKHILVKDSFEIDAVIYTVLGDDAARKFHYRHEFMSEEEGNHLNQRSVGINYHHSWDEQSYPQELSEAEMWFIEAWLVMSSDEVNLVEVGEWEMSVPWRPYFFEELVKWGGVFLGQFVPAAQAKEADFLETGQYQIMLEMSQMHDLLDVPILCFNLPASIEQQRETKQFAEIIGADYFNEQNLDLKVDVEWESFYIEGDGHWTQAGADFFAMNNHNILKDWLKKIVLENEES